MFDEDFSSVCGEFADLDGDGTVDMEEYLNEEEDYNRIMGILFCSLLREQGAGMDGLQGSCGIRQGSIQGKQVLSYRLDAGRRADA